MTTIHDSILNYLRNNSGSSAYKIATELDYDLATVSTLLKRMTDNKELNRTKGLGPRGGFGYFINKKELEDADKVSQRV